MRYALVGFYDSTGVVVCSDDVGYAATAAAETTSRRQRDNIIIAGSSMPRTVEPSEINCYRTRQEERGDPGFNNDDRLMVWNERLGRFANL